MRAVSLRAADLAGLSSQILSQGGAFCFRAHGSSMAPFVRNGDLLTVRPVGAAALRVGDVALCRAAGDRLVAHRVVTCPGKGGARAQSVRTILTIRGDAALGPGEPVQPDQLLGRVVSVKRGDKTLDLDRGAWRLAARLWIAAAPLGSWLLHGVVKLKQLAAWLLCRLHGARPYRSLARKWIGREVHYRAATAEDAPALSALYGYGQMPELDDPVATWLEHLAHLEGRGCAPVATLGGRIVGAAVVEPSPHDASSPSDWWIWGMLVAVRYRGAGVGQGLLCRALQAAREAGAARVYLRVSEANRPAMALYHKMGFQPAAPADDGPHRHAGSGGTLYAYCF